MSRIKFKTYQQNQLLLLPPSLEELIAEDHAVRVLNQVIDGLDITILEKRYEGGGTSSYHPRMLLKVLIYGYLNNTYSSRKIEEAVCSNIHFMWLSGMQRPDHNTINRFRGERLKGILKPIFGQIVELLVEAGLISLKKGYIDGTKIEADANKYTFVWGKSIANSKAKIVEQLEELWAYAESMAQKEMNDSNELKLSVETIDSEQVKTAINQINERLNKLETDSQFQEQLAQDDSFKKKYKKAKAKLKYANKNWSNKLEEYKEKEEILDGRSSYSKTDTDATFMRMKEDHMKNGQLKPGYNLQMTTENQCILNYDLYANPTDTLTFIPHLNSFEELYNQTLEEAIADSGYGSQENYEFLEEQQIEGYVKYNYFHKELKQDVQKEKGKSLKKPFEKQHLYYNEQGDFFICPMGQRIEKRYDTHRTTASGFKQKYGVYQAKNCENCPLRGVCHQSKDNRKIYFNQELHRHKVKAKKNLTSEKGKEHRSQRPADVEATFGNIKWNKKFKRFLLRGKEKTTVEIGLISIAHNLAKLAKYGQKVA